MPPIRHIEHVIAALVFFKFFYFAFVICPLDDFCVYVVQVLYLYVHDYALIKIDGPRGCTFFLIVLFSNGNLSAIFFQSTFMSGTHSIPLEPSVTIAI